VDPDAEWNDYVDFKLKVEDHGDNRMTCTVSLNNSKVDFIEAKQYMPEFNPSQIYIAGAGNQVVLRSIKI
jgi:hypothetical protein